jgi:hypothetical protein
MSRPHSLFCGTSRGRQPGGPTPNGCALTSTTPRLGKGWHGATHQDQRDHPGERADVHHPSKCLIYLAKMIDIK